ncbi:MAG: hypothetical protein LBF69_05910 [Prevotellaceae bacterium]|jgi:hypothetical protein|nr:hypothetical protein [Prevotellaceae bacterium]
MKQKITENAYLTFVEADGKFSFSSENKNLQKWVDTCKQKRVKLSEIHFVVNAAKKYMRNGVITAPSKKARVAPQGINPVSELNELVQKKYGQSIKTEIISYSPDIAVDVILPDGSAFTGYGENQKIARIDAAIKALEIEFILYEIRRK